MDTGMPGFSSYERFACWITKNRADCVQQQLAHNRLVLFVVEGGLGSTNAVKVGVMAAVYGRVCALLARVTAGRGSTQQQQQPRVYGHAPVTCVTETTNRRSSGTKHKNDRTGSLPTLHIYYLCTSHLASLDAWHASREFQVSPTRSFAGTPPGLFCCARRAHRVFTGYVHRRPKTSASRLPLFAEHRRYRFSP